MEENNTNEKNSNIDNTMQDSQNVTAQEGGNGNNIQSVESNNVSEVTNSNVEQQTNQNQQPNSQVVNNQNQPNNSVADNNSNNQVTPNNANTNNMAGTENTANGQQNPNEKIIYKEKIIYRDSNKKMKKGIIIRTVEFLWRLFLIALIVISLIVLVRAFVFHKYDFMGYRVYLIMSGSMEPTIHVSDAVITKEQTTYNQNDVIAFNYGGAVTVHRVKKVYHENGAQLFQTQGDNNNAIDSGLRNQGEILGKVVFRIPKAGDVIIFVKNNYVIILILIIGIALIVFLLRRLF